MQPHVGFAYASSHTLLSAGGRFYGATVAMKPDATSATYYLALVDIGTAVNASDDLSSAPFRVLTTLPVVHVSGVSEIINIGADDYGFENESGYRCNNGCRVILSSTALTSVTLSANLWLVRGATS